MTKLKSHILSDIAHGIAYLIELGLLLPLRVIFICTRAFHTLWRSLRPISERERKNFEAWNTSTVYRSTGCMYGYINALHLYPQQTHLNLTLKGWIFHPIEMIAELNIPTLKKYTRVKIIKLERQDVFDAFPSAPYSRVSGFMLLATLPKTISNELPSQIQFECTLKNGKRIDGIFSLPEKAIIHNNDSFLGEAAA